MFVVHRCRAISSTQRSNFSRFPSDHFSHLNQRFESRHNLSHVAFRRPSEEASKASQATEVALHKPGLATRLDNTHTHRVLIQAPLQALQQAEA